MRWRHKGDSLPNNTLGALLSAQEMETYSSLKVLLQILTILPVSTGRGEWGTMSHFLLFVP